ncbi:palmdelphin [Mixophyes fleayi]|uniref:palmdelphin n=1 Tax=Mixophyes fleayi TaxID=3061075 RepID=UPI003F4E1B97
MEEAELLKERLLAITDKRKLQEEIAQSRLKIEEEKLSLHHIKKKALREKWLLDGLSTMTPEEQEETLRQNQEDQKQIKRLEHNIGRLEQEIDDLEKQETQLSAKEVRVLQRLKSVERTTEDILKAMKYEVREEPVQDVYAGIPDLPPSYKPAFIRRMDSAQTENGEELRNVQDIYAGIPDLPPSYKPAFIRKMESAQTENGEEPRKALFAMEIKVEKDRKTGKNTVLSTVPLPSSEFKDTGVKVYDDGRKSVYAVNSEGKMEKTEVDSLAPMEVEDLLRKATKKSTQSPTVYHEPVYSNEYNNSSTHKGQVSPRLNGHNSPIITDRQNGHSPIVAEDIPVIKKSSPEEPIFSQPRVIIQNKQAINAEPLPKEDHHEAMFMNSGVYTTEYPPTGLKDDMHYNIVHAKPCYVDDSEPVTMIFMGYEHADESENKPLTDYEGVIRAELVVIDDDDDDDDDDKGEDKNVKGLIYPPETQSHHVSYPAMQNSVSKKLPKHNITLQSPQPYKNSISLQEQDASLGSHDYLPVTKQIIDDGTEDPSLTALRIRMAKLGKKVI